MTGEIEVGYQFDRDAVWEKVKGRKAVFLDSMVWINMADGKSEAQPLKAKLRERVRAGDVFCPVSPTLVWELYKQEFSKLRTAALMEEFSLNVSFPLTKNVFEWEVRCFAKRLVGQEDDGCSRKMLFLPALGYVASSFSVEYPPGWTADAVRDFGQRLSAKLNSMGLTELVGLRDDDLIGSYFRNHPPVPYQNEAKFFQSFAKGDRGKVWRVEEQSVFLNYILPAVRKLPIPHMLAVLAFAQTAEPDAVGNKVSAFLRHTPAIHNHIEVMFRASEDPNRKDKPSDFFDLNMMPVPLAYGDVFVSLDRWVRERFLKPGGFCTRNPCKFCSTYAELETWLDAN